MVRQGGKLTGGSNARPLNTSFSFIYEVSTPSKLNLVSTCRCRKKLFRGTRKSNFMVRNNFRTKARLLSTKRKSCRRNELRNLSRTQKSLLLNYRHQTKWTRKRLQKNRSREWRQGRQWRLSCPKPKRRSLKTNRSRNKGRRWNKPQRWNPDRLSTDGSNRPDHQRHRNQWNRRRLSLKPKCLSAGGKSSRKRYRRRCSSPSNRFPTRTTWQQRRQTHNLLRRRSRTCRLYGLYDRG